MSNTTQAAPNVITGTPWAWGFEDGAQGRSLYDGYNVFCGCKFLQYEAGWNAGREAMAHKHASDPAVQVWMNSGAPMAGCTWSGDYSGIDGHGEMRLTVASN